MVYILIKNYENSSQRLKSIALKHESQVSIVNVSIPNTCRSAVRFCWKLRSGRCNFIPSLVNTEAGTSLALNVFIFAVWCTERFKPTFHELLLTWGENWAYWLQISVTQCKESLNTNKEALAFKRKVDQINLLYCLWVLNTFFQFSIPDSKFLVEIMYSAENMSSSSLSFKYTYSPIPGQLTKSFDLVPRCSTPRLSTHQHSPVNSEHCTSSNLPSSLQRGTKGSLLAGVWRAFSTASWHSVDSISKI